MVDTRIADVFARVLEHNGVSYSPNARLVENFGLDSQHLVDLILELETVLDQELDDGVIEVIAHSSLDEVFERLGRLVDDKEAD